MLILITGYTGFLHKATSQNIATSIKGQILNAETNRPIDKVNVFLSGTTIGASTDQSGKYFIKGPIPKGQYSLVFSHINYSITSQIIVVATSQKLTFNKVLIPKKSTLGTVTVAAKRDRKWEQHFQVFKKEFLGTSSIGRKCKIANPWVLNFKEKHDTLYATAKKELVVENPSLGYKIFFTLKKFKTHQAHTTYLGESRFEKLTPKDQKQTRKWDKARNKAFYGSFRHFACALMYKRLSKEGFVINYNADSPAQNQQLNGIKAENILYKNQIIFPYYLNITYKEYEDSEYINWITQRTVLSQKLDRLNKARYQSSWIKIKGNHKLKVSNMGVIMDSPDKLQSYGYWAWQRLGNLLPADFFPEELLQKIKLSRIHVVKQLDEYLQNEPQEKVYLHQDKAYYALGDTLWLSGYVVNAKTHKPSNLSKIVYVDLIDENNQVKQQLKLYNDQGKTAGEFIIDPKYSPGMYRLRAYTQLMLDAGQRFFFNRRFEVGLPVNSNSLKIKLNFKNKSLATHELINYQFSLKDKFNQPLVNKKVTIVAKANGKTYASQKFTISKKGKIKGQIQIPSSEKAPYIELIAQTGKKDHKVSKKFHVPLSKTKVAIGFFPEGGYLINGLNNQVAFKATNKQGAGVPVKGQIVDESGNKVVSFASSHLGMGKFSFVPQVSVQYTAVVVQSDSTTLKTDLPASRDNGFVLSIAPAPEDQSVITVQSRKKQRFTLIAHCRGEAVYTVAGKSRKNKPFEATIKHKDLPAGIIHFTLFDNELTPRCERLIFAGKKQNALDINLKVSKNAAPRKRTELKFNVKNLKNHHPLSYLSVAVIDEGLNSDKRVQNHILSSLLLTSDLKGYIENPAFYFRNKEPQTLQALDLLMMTQGWRRFTWQQVQKGEYRAKNALKKGFTITGKVTNMFGKTMAHGMVTLMNFATGTLKVAETNDKGKFVFKDLPLVNGTKILLKAVSLKGKKRLEITLDKSSDVLPITVLNDYPKPEAFVVDQHNTHATRQGVQGKRRTVMGKFNGAIPMLDEVEITAGKIDWLKEKKRIKHVYNEPTYRLKLDSGIHKPNNNDDFLSYLKGRIPGLAIKPDPNQFNVYKLYFRYSDGTTFRGDKAVLCLLNEQPVDFTALMGLQLDEIAYIDMLSSAKAAMYGMMSVGEGNGSAANGVLAVYLKKDAKSSLTIPKLNGLLSLTYTKGFHTTRQFYVPPYHNKAFAKKNLPDVRSTVYWNPFVKVENGEAKINFYNADAPSRYKIVVEGISQEGDIGRKIGYYEVKAKE